MGWCGESEDQIEMGSLQSSIIATGGSGGAGTGADVDIGRVRAAAEAAGDVGSTIHGAQGIIGVQWWRFHGLIWGSVLCECPEWARLPYEIT